MPVAHRKLLWLEKGGVGWHTDGMQQQKQVQRVESANQPTHDYFPRIWISESADSKSMCLAF